MFQQMAQGQGIPQGMAMMPHNLAPGMGQGMGIMNPEAMANLTNEQKQQLMMQMGKIPFPGNMVGKKEEEKK